MWCKLKLDGYTVLLCYAVLSDPDSLQVDPVHGIHHIVITVTVLVLSVVLRHSGTSSLLLVAAIRLSME